MLLISPKLLTLLVMQFFCTEQEYQSENPVVISMVDKAIQFLDNQKALSNEYCDKEAFLMILEPSIICFTGILSLLVIKTAETKRMLDSKKDKILVESTFGANSMVICEEIISAYRNEYENICVCASILGLDQKRKSKFVGFFNSILCQLKEVCLYLNMQNLSKPMHAHDLIKISTFVFKLFLQINRERQLKFNINDLKTVQNLITYIASMTLHEYLPEAA